MTLSVSVIVILCSLSCVKVESFSYTYPRIRALACSDIAQLHTQTHNAINHTYTRTRIPTTQSTIHIHAPYSYKTNKLIHVHRCMQGKIQTHFYAREQDQCWHDRQLSRLASRLLQSESHISFGIRSSGAATCHLGTLRNVFLAHVPVE
jgi:hypothetical protein